MKNLRIYGNKPFNVAVIHGEPGAPGSMARVARELAANIMTTRLDRLSKEERKELHSLTATLNNPAAEDKNTLMARLGRLCTKTDSYNPLTLDTETLECQYDIHMNVWDDASTLRSTGKLPDLGKQIRCPVTVLHGDYDPHPFDGVRRPLASILKDFKFFLLKNCGHYPWLEREAKERFFEILNEEL